MHKASTLTILACLFWLLPLAMTISALLRFGWHDDAYSSLGIPCAMITLTTCIAIFAPRSRFLKVIVVVASAIALFAGLWWLAIWGRDV